jgi:predicted DNA-binding transcriptional regulator YafY
MISDMGPLVDALRNKLIVSLDYMKETGEVVIHRVGIYEIGPNKKGNDSLWGWDVDLQDHIRNFLISNIQNFQVLTETFNPPQPYPLKLNGEIIGY